MRFEFDLLRVSDAELDRLMEVSTFYGFPAVYSEVAGGIRVWPYPNEGIGVCHQIAPKERVYAYIEV